MNWWIFSYKGNKHLGWFSVKMYHSTAPEWTLKDKYPLMHTHAHGPTDSAGVSLNVHFFLHKTFIFPSAPHRVTYYSKHALNPLLKEIQKRLTQTHICGVDKYPQGRRLDSLFVERTTKCLNHKPGAPNLDRQGLSRTWCHSHSKRSPTSDKVALSGKSETKRETDNPFVFSILISSYPMSSRQEWLQPKAIQTFITEMVHVIIMPQRHAESVWVWTKSRTCLMNYQCWGCSSPLVLNENNLWHIKLMKMGLESKCS